MKQLFFALLLSLTGVNAYAIDCNSDVQKAVTEMNSVMEKNMEMIIAESMKSNPDLVKLKAVKIEISKQMANFCVEYQKSYTVADSCTVTDNKGETMPLQGQSTYDACAKNAEELKQLEAQP